MGLFPVCCISQEKRSFAYQNLSNSSFLSEKAGNYIRYNEIRSSFNESDLKKLKDHTKLIQGAIDSQDTVILPNYSLRISQPGLILRNNSVLIFQQGSELIMIPNNLTHYEMISLNGVENVTIVNPKLVGDREDHVGTTGEWGMGINILSSNNVKILNPKISNCWGDGIYIGRNKMKNASFNIEIIGGHIDFNRRNGISIISAENLKIENTVISNTYGTMPMSGIDIEPNLDDEILKNVTINNVKTINNFSEGIKIVFANIFNPNDKIGVKINNHYDLNSSKALTLVGIRPEHSNKRSLLSGVVEIVNPKWERNLQTIEFQKDMNIGVKVSVKNGRVITEKGSKRLRAKMLESSNRSLLKIN